MSSKSGLIPASELRKRLYGGDVINIYVKEIFKSINLQLREALECGLEETTISMPTTFDVNGLDNRRAQMHIYNAVREELTNQGYHFIFQYHEKKVSLNITWISPKDDEYERYINEMMRECSEIY